MIKIEYWNSYDILDVHYDSGYKNWFWLDVDVKKPAYIIDRDAVENSFGETVTNFMRWSKQYKFDVFCLEPLADALSTITMHDQVWITLDNGYSAKVKDFIADVTWTEIDNLAKVSISMVVNSYNVNGLAAAGCI